MRARGRIALFGGMLLACVIAPAPVWAGPLTVNPSIGGPQTTFRVVFAPPVANSRYEVRVTPRCAGSRSAYPWHQQVQLLGRPLLRMRATIQLPRPVGGGWCPGTFRGGIFNLYRKPHRVATFAFVVRRGVKTRLPTQPCRPRGTTTLAQSRTARIFTIRVGQFTFTDGCVFGVRGNMQLASGYGYGSPSRPEREWLTNIRLAGPFVGYVLNSPGPADVETDLKVTDLRTGDGLWGHFVFGVSAFVVHPKTGATAWVGGLEEAGGRGVGRLRPGGFTLLDKGEQIDPQSLRLSGSTLTWTNAGVVKSATL